MSASRRSRSLLSNSVFSGVALLAAGMAPFLTPLSIWSYQSQQWRSPLITCLIISGGLLIVGFALYEYFPPPVNFVLMWLLAGRNVVLSGFMLLLVFFSSCAPCTSNVYRVGSCLPADEPVESTYSSV
ncbi:hypothetical protein VTK56DRAFT_1303 [Thermocarpiscus australiensis]